MRLRAHVEKIYPRSGQVSGEWAMQLKNVCDAYTGDIVATFKNVTVNKHSKGIAVSQGDYVEFDGKVSQLGGKTTITNTRSFRKISNY